jgi:uncharacterized membrane protein YdjX (TVP38/TMEM64 family)
VAPAERNLTQTRSWPLAVLAFVCLAGPLTGATMLAWTHADWMPQLEQSESRLGWFTTLGALSAGLSLLPTHAVSLVGGMLFGGVGGTMAATASVTLAALLAYLVMRPMSSRRTASLLSRRPRAQAVQQALLHSGSRRTTSVVVLVRLSPLMPFALTNMLMAALGTRLPEFTTGTVLGLMPRVALVAFAGEGLRELDLSRGSDRVTLAVGTVVTVAALVVLGRIARRALPETA